MDCHPFTHRKPAIRATGGTDPLAARQSLHRLDRPSDEPDTQTALITEPADERRPLGQREMLGRLAARLADIAVARHPTKLSDSRRHAAATSSKNQANGNSASTAISRRWRIRGSTMPRSHRETFTWSMPRASASSR